LNAAKKNILPKINGHRDCAPPGPPSPYPGLRARIIIINKYYITSLYIIMTLVEFGVFDAPAVGRLTELSCSSSTQSLFGVRFSRVVPPQWQWQLIYIYIYIAIGRHASSPERVLQYNYDVCVTMSRTRPLS